MTNPAPAHADELPAVQCRKAASHDHTAILPTGILPGAVAGADLITRDHVRGDRGQASRDPKGTDNTRQSSGERPEPERRQGTCIAGTHSLAD